MQMSCYGVTAGAGLGIRLMSTSLFSFLKMAADREGKFSVDLPLLCSPI